MARVRLGTVRGWGLWTGVLGEYLGSVFVMILATFLQVSHDERMYTMSTLQTGLTVGLFVVVIVQTFLPISGAFMNPVGCFVCFLDGRIPFTKALLYTISELLGAATGSSIVLGLTPSNHKFFPLRPADDLSTVQGALTELVLTVYVFFVVLSVTDSESRQVEPAMVAVAIGLAIGTCIMASGTCTGATMNPLIAFGPAVVSRDFRDHWVYWAGPYAGGVVALIFYRILKLCKQLADKQSSDISKDKPSATSAQLVGYSLKPNIDNTRQHNGVQNEAFNHSQESVNSVCKQNGNLTASYL